MPRTTIDLPYQVEYLSILDENGNLDREIEPNIPNELLLQMHHGMLLARRADERMLSLQRQGRIGTFGPIKGQEAAQIGTGAAMRDSDWMVPSFRETAIQLWRGIPLESILLLYGGFEEGALGKVKSNNMPTSIPVASQVPQASGLGYAIKYRKTDQVVVVFFGDGATSEGDFHEGMNFAGVFQLPVVFLCQNNQWAISMPRAKQTHSKTLAQKALAYGFPGIQVDGNDILAVYSSVSEAVERARGGGGPTMVEAVTYRLSVHTTADDPTRYRSTQEVEEWNKRDPILRFEKYLLEKGVMTRESVEQDEEAVKNEIQSAVERAEARMNEIDDPLHIFEHIYAELTPNMREQREELAQELGVQAGKEGGNG